MSGRLAIREVVAHVNSVCNAGNSIFKEFTRGVVISICLSLIFIYIYIYIHMCVCVTGHWPAECVQIMRWWSSNLGQ